MRADLIFRFESGFERWTSTSTQDGSGQIIRQYTLHSNREGLPIPSNAGLQLMTRTPLAIMDQVRNLRDRFGNLLAGDIMWVHNVVPQVDAFGRVIGYKAILRETQPRDIEGRLDALIRDAQ